VCFASSSCTLQPTIQVGAHAKLTGDFWFRQIRIRTWRATDIRQLTWLDKPQQLTETGEYCTWPSRDPPPSQGISAGMEITGKIHQVEVTENNFFYCSWITWCSTRVHTHPVRCHDTSKRVAWRTFFCLSLITRCQNSKLGRCRLTAGSKRIG
jgi:hypothetical protein